MVMNLLLIAGHNSLYLKDEILLNKLKKSWSGCCECVNQDRLQRILAFLVLIFINVQGTGVTQKNTDVLEQRNDSFWKEE
jgi:hypothetical protein